MALWKRLWLLFTVMWLVVAALNIVTILAFGDEVAPEKAWRPFILAFVVPAVAYGLGWAWQHFRSWRKKSGSDPD